MTLMIKKIYWAEKNKSFNISATIVMRVILNDLIETIETKILRGKIDDKLLLIKQLTTNLSIRVGEVST